MRGSVEEPRGLLKRSARCVWPECKVVADDCSPACPQAEAFRNSRATSPLPRGEADRETHVNRGRGKGWGCGLSAAVCLLKV